MFLAVSAAILAPSGAALAQDESIQIGGGAPPRGLFAAINAEIYRPDPDFRGYIGRPTGVTGHLTVPVWTRGSTSLGIRGDAFWVRHFHKELTYDVSMAREFYGGLVGPQLSLATGPVRPYIAAGYGTTRYWTVINVDEGCDTSEPDCVDQDRVRRSDYEASTVLTGGTYIRLTNAASSLAVLLHVAGQIHRGGTPDVRTLRDGTSPGQPDARYVSWQVGVSIGGR
jgi:hypothetical protein